MCALTTTTGAEGRVGRERQDDNAWPVERWAGILDRIEFRRPNVGLRYWGPPLWLEVTMTGPDADAWPAATDHTLSWDWQSSVHCPLVDDLLAAGTDDDTLVAIAGRYTIENLILNAVHEIGEWFRLDGRRVFPAHIGGLIGPGERDVQGNGVVEVQIAFDGPLGAQRADEGVAPCLDEATHEGFATQLWTCMPRTTIAIETTGPVVRTHAPGAETTTWRSAWSSSTIERCAARSEDALDVVTRDVHRALVLAETDRICRAFHIDGRRPWYLRDSDAAEGHPIAVAIRYSDGREVDASL